MPFDSIAYFQVLHFHVLGKLIYCSESHTPFLYNYQILKLAWQ